MQHVGIDALADLLGDPERGLQRAGAQEPAELVAAEPCREIDRADSREQQRSDVAQQLVARGMAGGVVDRLEAVEVDVEHARDLAPTAVGEMLGELALELLAVRDVGEGVVRRRPRQRIALAALLADVAERPDRSLAGFVRAHRSAEQMAPEATAVAADELDL